MFTIKTKKITFILTLCLSITPLKAMDDLDSGTAAPRSTLVEGVAVEMVVIDEDSTEKAGLIAELAAELDKSDEDLLMEFSLEKLRKLKMALSLIPSMDPASKSNYISGFAAYQGTDWNGNVTQLLAHGLGERVPDLCNILVWAAEALDVFTTETLIITRSLNIDGKVAVMKALSSRHGELKVPLYVSELKKKFGGGCCRWRKKNVSRIIKAAREKCGLPLKSTAK